MRVTLRCRCLRVTQQLADDRQAEARTCADAGVSVSQIVNPHVIKSCPPPNGAPRLVKVGARLLVVGAGVLARDDIGTYSRQRREHGHGRSVENDCSLAGFAIGQEQQPPLKIDVLPAQVQDFAEPGTGENQQPDCRRRVRADHGVSVPLFSARASRSALSRPVPTECLWFRLRE